MLRCLQVSHVPRMPKRCYSCRVCTAACCYAIRLAAENSVDNVSSNADCGVHFFTTGGPVFGTPSRIAQAVSPQLPALVATIAGGAAATAAPAEAPPRLQARGSVSGGFGLQEITSSLASSYVSSCCGDKSHSGPETQWSQCCG